MSQENPALQEIKNVILITLGSCMLAIGVTFFILPAHIVTGGTPGIALILHYTFDASLSMSMILVNVPLLFAGIKFIDLKFAARTLYSINTTAVTIAFLPALIDFPQISSVLLATIYGGVCVGAGIGLVLKGNASAGGTTIIAKLFSNYFALKPAQTLLVLDVIIISTVGVLSQNMELALWSFLSIYITTRIVDKVLTGSVAEKVVSIVSDHHQEIGTAISSVMKRDGTVLSGINLTEEKDKRILFAVVGTREIQKLKSMVLEIDPSAIILIMEASEMMGSSYIAD